ncbi:hypothetical protein SAY86_004382 [Trapa natans]|uniref:RNA helicase n=1 Tax=Trapa natans TaxID=22666 RepID=A0AAN7MYK8_TRANT|nr:hypothetical protein SAY86_004382 [Trapa natans]
MAPKKRHQQKQASKPKTNSNKSSSVSSSGPKLQLSAENEDRLRRLLLNSSVRPAAASSPADDSLSVAQKAKRLKIVYEKLSCEGFSNDQIEQALSALKDGATFESALDWLCLNLHGDELPLKFSSGSSTVNTGGTINVLVSAREDWTPEDSSSRVTEEVHGFSARIKEQSKDDALDSDRQLQADWIRQYMENQEDDDSGTWEDQVLEAHSHEKVLEPRSYDVIGKEYLDARHEAVKAKENRDKKAQEQAGLTIRKLKQELFALGLSDDMLAMEFDQKHYFRNASEDMSSGAVPVTFHVEVSNSSNLHVDNATPERTNTDNQNLGNLKQQSGPQTEPIHGQNDSEDNPEEVELGDLFVEEASGGESSEVSRLHRKAKMRRNKKNLEGFWKKEDPPKMPKAVLHQFCQRSGWEAPKFDKMVGKDRGYSYTVNVVRKASGRGKSRKPGGLVIIKLPDNEEVTGSAEDAQNKVAAFALFQLFPDLPVHLVVAEPYASIIRQWIEGEETSNIEDTEEDRRADFVNLLLKSSTKDVAESLTSEKLHIEESISSTISIKAAGPRVDHSKEVESSYLIQDQENRKHMQKYKIMLKARSTLPIAGLRNEILQVLKEHDVLVVCGETGSGKTTQVPQFILDYMIESGQGGYCNIICTQPRRIAAISVAERVSEERCESSPGSKGSLVGYQVRLDSARNDKTKLLFCTTGILLRKLAGDNKLTGITHIIVDEVHERSLLGDFLLIILKNILEKQSSHGGWKLKVILMSATVDSTLFSRYFGNCPVITAEGRMHPVKVHFLEDIYETLNYRLASDSPAAIKYETSSKRGPVDNRRGKKNLVLSGWGDDSLLSEDCVNPYYMSSSYESYSEQTQQNLRKLNEDVIDYDLLEDLIVHIDENCGEGAILVFLPGIFEIYMLVDKLTASHRFGGSSSDWILPLHSSIAPNDQKKVFQRPPERIRKIIVATNIAETSITIDDIVYVIDSGKHKENRYDPRKKLTSMVEDWISQANAKQRRGRAGRVKPGTCFCMYTRDRLEKLMRAFQAPEILRMPLVELCLQIKLLSLGFIKPFLLKAIEPPKEEAMNSAIGLLYEVTALEGNEELTPLGYHLAKLPVDVLIGKMMLYGAIFGCLSPILSISAFLSYKSPFLYPKDEKQNVERVKFALMTDKADSSNQSDGDKQSDHILMMVAYKRWEKILREKGGKAAQQFCSSYFLSSPVMFMIRDMRIQFATLLADIGLISLPKNLFFLIISTFLLLDL